MDKLEQVSENPELKQEMEAEVASTNSNQVSYIGVKVRIFVSLELLTRLKDNRIFSLFIYLGYISS